LAEIRFFVGSLYVGCLTVDKVDNEAKKKTREFVKALLTAGLAKTEKEVTIEVARAC